MKSIRILSAAVLAAMLCGCGNAARSVAPDLTGDTTPPPAVTGMSVVIDARAGDVTLLWEASAAPDVSSYEIYTAAGNQYDLVGSTAATQYGVPAGPSVYAVRAVDNAGNRSPYTIWDGTDGGNIE